MVRSCAFLCLLLGLSLPMKGQIQDHVFEQITSKAGITFNAVSSIVEDDYGFLWFGTASGLYYYNTSEIIQYSFDPLKEDSPPSNRINNLYRDDQGIIWICTDRGVCQFNEASNSFVRLQFKNSNEEVAFGNVLNIAQYKDGRYLAIVDQYLYYFDSKDYALHKLSIGEQNEQISFLGRGDDDLMYVGTKTGKVYKNSTSISDFELFYDQGASSVTRVSVINNQVWIGYEYTGIDIVNLNGEKTGTYREDLGQAKRIASNRIRDIVKRGNNEIWIGTSVGVSIISESGIYNINQNYLLNGLPHISVFDLHVDQKNGVWVGTWSGGLAYYNEYNYKFPHVRLTRNSNRAARSVISSFAENEDGSIWIGVENYDLEKFSPETMTFINQDLARTPWPISRIKCITTDKDNRHWVGTLYEGLWSIKDNEFKRIGNISGIFSSVLAVDGGVWVGTRLSGLIFYDHTTDNFSYFKSTETDPGSISSNNIWDIFQDSRENLWVCSDFGLSVRYKGKSDFVRYYYKEEENSLSRNLNYTITEDSSGKLWIGTSGAGIDIFDPTSNTFSKFELNEAIQNAEVYCILQDQQENMWFSTNQGIYVYYTQTKQLRNFSEQDGLLGKQYHPNSGFISSAGKVFFGGGDGFNIIDPTTVKQNPLAPEVFLSKLLINNKSLQRQKPKYVDSQFPAGISDLELTYNQNSLTLGFVSNNFIKSSGNRFRYRMKDYLDDWIETAHASDVTFTKIPPGKYVLEVLAANNDGVWSTEPKTFQIRIAPPFWLSWYAYLFYGLLLSLSVLFFFRELRFREKSRADRILFSEKVRFFTNVSHEFRTPLTLVLSPLNNLMKRFGNDPSAMSHIKIIKRNADRLLHLTNQVLDFRLIELDKLQLKREEEDVVNLCRKAFECFEYEATEKQINCIFNSSFTSFHLLVDAKKMEKIIYNLLSNGLKYSPEKGQIILSIEKVDLAEHSYTKNYYTGHKFFGNALEIKVKDTGKGIKKTDVPHVFDRFFISEESEETGIGVGLHMCQEYVHLHGGNIMVTSEEGLGTVFTVNIPVEHSLDYQQEDMIIQYHFDKIAETKELLGRGRESVALGKLVLYVEDNDELRMYYKNLLSTRYRVLTAKNGQQALEIAGEVVPDMIISDVLMPGMNGLLLTEQLRRNTKTDHIPIILLTALSDEKYKIESMSKGANAFITKPVDEAFLFAKIANIFKRQDTIAKKLIGRSQGQLVDLKRFDSFSDTAKNIVLKNLRNPGFGVTEFAAALNMSRSSLQRKIKAEVNLSPTEFIRDIRLNQAIELMKAGAYNIDEIGSLVGFNSTSYFIRSFKKKYGKTPFSFQSELKVEK